MNQDEKEMPAPLFRELIAGMTQLGDNGYRIRYIMENEDGRPSESLEACRISRSRWLVEHTLITRPWGPDRGPSRVVRRFTARVPEDREQGA